MSKSMEELNDILFATEVEFDLEFVGRLMRAMEIAIEYMPHNSEQTAIVEGYKDTLYHEITDNMTPEEFSDAEDFGLLDLD